MLSQEKATSWVFWKGDYKSPAEINALYMHMHKLALPILQLQRNMLNELINCELEGN